MANVGSLSNKQKLDIVIQRDSEENISALILRTSM